MRFHLLLFLCASALLTSCSLDDESGPRVDLVGGTRFLSASRTVTTAANTSALADTFTTRVFAEKRDDGAELDRLVITVEYSPSPFPFVYPSTAFNLDSLYKIKYPVVYLDTMLTGKQRQSIAFQFKANTRTTSGREKWIFDAYDADNNKNSRSFTLSLRNSDSLRAATYHNYTVILPAPTTPYARNSISLLSGLTLPPNALRRRIENQDLIDLAYLPLANGERALASPNDPELIRTNRLFNPTNWLSRRTTSMRSTDLDSARFASTADTAAFRSLFSSGVVPTISTRTNALRARGTGRVLAFRTSDSPARYGLIFIQSFLTAPTPAIKMQVRITK
ncbi:hypothetical protein [Hymenobacter sp. YC55]|uniref:hypothetical protein n=1 Tax=Hymenobacter sp. YC55 TaxID=3034019 RepID=UPI0023F6280F|nr:hypothetical protein [Hymenobacter sp. YC55]MDF7812723.1 hypothetical protein [Hymenobacter sp. YC55]